MDTKDNDLNWLNDFEEMADEKLGDGSACEQIHPIVEHWLDEWLESEVPAPRSAVAQALACLATEVLNIMPESIVEALLAQCDEDEIYEWVQSILITGGAFQAALNSGRLDDL